jgi:hypothetical protein
MGDEKALQDEENRLIRETPGANNMNDVLRARGVDAFLARAPIQTRPNRSRARRQDFPRTRSR